MQASLSMSTPRGCAAVPSGRLLPVSDATLDAVVVGSGPNGLAAAVTLARAGLSVEVLEAQPTVGGGARTLDLGLADGLVHDICSAVHPMAVAAPFMKHFDLAARGVRFATPEVSYAQPLDGGRAALAYRDIDRTAKGLGVDGPTWKRLLGPLARHQDRLVDFALGDYRSVPRSIGGLLTTAQFALRLLDQGTPAWNRRFDTEEAAALLTGVSAHAISRMPSIGAAGSALLLAPIAHGSGWPIPVGGSGAMVAALVQDLEAHGGRVHADAPVAAWGDLPPARAYLFDTTPRTVLQVLGDRMPRTAAARLDRFRYGNAAAKVDYVLSGPVPWTEPEVGRAGTVHVGGTRAQMARAEAEVASGRHADQPVVLLSDPATLDPAREVGGLRPLWTYAHVPAGSNRDVTDDVTAQIERFAPGFRDVVVASRCVPAAEMSNHNANYVGGDVAAGAVTTWQVLARPTPTLNPYRTGADGVYICSASSPPGPGVHGMCGWFAARTVLRERFGIRTMPSLAPSPPSPPDPPR